MTNSINADKGDWVDDFAPRKDGGGKGNDDRPKLEWMKFPEPGDYSVRFVGNPVKYLKHNDPPFPFKNRVITHGSYKENDPAWQAGFYPSPFLAIFVIDRKDGGIKILDKSKKFFKSVSDFKKNEDIDPGGREAPDFVITVEWPEGNKRRAKYSINNRMKPAPFSNEEIEKIRSICVPVEMKDEDTGETVKVSRLQLVYRSTPLEKIIEAWEALPEESKIKKEWEGNDAKSDAKAESKADSKVVSKPAKAAVAEKPSTKSMEEEVTAASTEDDDSDLFGDDEDASF